MCVLHTEAVKWRCTCVTRHICFKIDYSLASRLGLRLCRHKQRCYFRWSQLVRRHKSAGTRLWCICYYQHYASALHFRMREINYRTLGCNCMQHIQLLITVRTFMRPEIIDSSEAVSEMNRNFQTIVL